MIIITVAGDAPIEGKQKEKLENYQDLRGEVGYEVAWLRCVSGKFEHQQKNGWQLLCNFNGFIFTK